MTNITNNRLSATLTHHELDDIKGAIQAITGLMPFLVGITTLERQRLPKINVANKAFTEDAINAIVANPDMLPAYIDSREVQKDYMLFVQLDEVALLLRQLLEKVTDTQTLAGSEAFVTALTGYQIFGAAAKAGIPGADAVYAQLRERFRGIGGRLPGNE